MDEHYNNEGNDDDHCLLKRTWSYRSVSTINSLSEWEHHAKFKINSQNETHRAE